MGRALVIHCLCPKLVVFPAHISLTIGSHMVLAKFKKTQKLDLCMCQKRGGDEHLLVNSSKVCHNVLVFYSMFTHTFLSEICM